MLNDVLTKEYIIQNGLEFEECLEYGGPYGLGIVECADDDDKEKLFTGLAYDVYENGNIKRISNMNRSTAEGYHVEFFQNGMKKHESECIAGREMTFKKYDEQGNIVEQKIEPTEFDILYAKKFSSGLNK
ncbi:toxin-antitoxin system YwqK family antitoxin [Bacillus wiedmannii]|uniref:toxin-antitoxin system YwqK family antitoxin n=1 Tax=Bacillus wiedmannii TaxID=1890302 RepID=UPI003D1A0796